MMGHIIVVLAWFVFLCSWTALSFIYKNSAPKSRDKKWFLFLISIVLITVVAEYLFSDYLLKRFEFPFPFSHFTDIAGIILILAGFSFAVWARITLGIFWSGSIALIENQPIIREGPYAIVRHPIYTGVITMLWGSFLLIEIGAFLFVSIIGTIILLLKAKLEESLLEKYREDEYLNYKKRVPLIPFL